MPELSRDTAVSIIKALRSGTVPDEGLEHFAVGLDSQMSELGKQMDYVATGKSDFKFVRGGYGAGKTFLCSLAAAEALGRGFVVTKVVVSGADAPLHKLDEVYRKLCQGITLTGGRRGQLQAIIDRWLYKLEDQVIQLDRIDESDANFQAAVENKIDQHLRQIADESGRFAACIKAYHKLQFEQNFVDSQSIIDWLSGEKKVTANVKKLANIKGDLEKTDILSFLRGLLTLFRQTDYQGLLLVLDEAETVLRLRTKNERGDALENLRLLVDGITQNEYPGLYLLVTGTPDFFENPRGVPNLEPLKQRLHVEFREDGRDNLRQPQIRLQVFDEARLKLVAEKVRDIFPGDHPERVRRRIDGPFLDTLVRHFTQAFGGKIAVTPRLFLRELVDQLDMVDQYDDHNPLQQYRFDKARLEKVGLREEEEEALGREVMM